MTLHARRLPRRLTALASYLVDPRVGLLSRVDAVRPQAGAPRFFHASARLGDTRRLPFSHQSTQLWVGAAAASRDGAVATCLLDAVALYCGAFRLEEDVPPVPASRASFDHVAPDRFVLFSDRQHAQEDFPWPPFDDATPVSWKCVLDPVEDAVTHVPARIVYFPYAPLAGHEEAPVAPATATGLAAHWDPAEAAVQAVCDVLEADALVRTWQTRASPPQVRIETLSDDNYDLVARFERTGATVTLLRLELGPWPATFLSVLSHPNAGAPALVFSAGTDPSEETAVRRSLERLAHAELYCRMLHGQMPSPGEEGADDPGEIEGEAAHLRYWSEHAHRPAMDFLLASQERVEAPWEEDEATDDDSRRRLDGLLRAVDVGGHRALLADLTTPDVRGLGLTALRAVVPGLQPLFFGRAQGGDNPYPHPFPRKGGMV